MARWGVPSQSHVDIVRRYTPFYKARPTLETLLASDLFASFMLDLATKRKLDLEKWIENQREEAVYKLGKHLVDRKLCDHYEARWLIMPALIASGIVTGEQVVTPKEMPSSASRNIEQEIQLAEEKKQTHPSRL